MTEETRDPDLEGRWIGIVLWHPDGNRALAAIYSAYDSPEAASLCAEEFNKTAGNGKYWAVSEFCYNITPERLKELWAERGNP